MSVECRIRQYERDHYDRLCEEGCSPTVARLLAARQVTSLEDMRLSFQDLHHPFLLLNNQAAGEILAQGIISRQRILVVGDYDCDGACAVAIAVRGLRMMGAIVDYRVPDRLTMSYGLSTTLLASLTDQPPDILVTVDNGISSHEAVALAESQGMRVVITDHHLPSETLPPASCIVNPCLPGCTFPSKALSGSGVIFYVLLSVRMALRALGGCAVEPPLHELLDFVCIGTLADLVSLDRNNRILIAGGLQRIRQGEAHVGIGALLRQARCAAEQVSQRDLVFNVIPRINAAGRLSEIAVAIECLLTDAEDEVGLLVKKIEKLNRQRRLLEKACYREALDKLQVTPAASAYVLYEPDWHLGLVGLVANRMKDKLNAPVLVLARAANGEIRGSGRAPKGYQLRQILSAVDEQLPGAFIAYGGHAQAVGLSLNVSFLTAFVTTFVSCAAERTPRHRVSVIETDGPLSATDFADHFVNLLRRLVWGVAFPAPTFCNYCEVLRVQPLGAYHRRLYVRCEGQCLNAYQWYPTAPAPSSGWFVYEIDWDLFAGEPKRIALTIREVLEKAPDRVAQMVTEDDVAAMSA